MFQMRRSAKNRKELEKGFVISIMGAVPIQTILYDTLPPVPNTVFGKYRLNGKGIKQFSTQPR